VTHKRILRVREAVRRELGIILDRKMSDPRVGMVTVTRVDLSDDLKYAKVFVSLFGDPEEKKTVLRILRKARRFIRVELSHSLRMRTAPEVSFFLDDSAEDYIRIDKVLKQIHAEDPERDGEDEDPKGP